VKLPVKDEIKAPWAFSHVNMQLAWEDFIFYTFNTKFPRGTMNFRNKARKMKNTETNR
jgi:hypothetical protein